MISVITIFLNGDRFLAEAIESVLAQTYSDWELLLVDDGSTDRAPAIAQSFVERFPEKIRYLTHPGRANRGMSASRNLGLAEVRGEFVCFLDADDTWRPEKLAEQLALLEAHPEVAYVYGPLELWRSWTGRPGDVDEFQSLGLAADRVIPGPELLAHFLVHEKNNPCGPLIRAEMFERAGGYEESFTGMYEDLVVQAKICLTHPVYASSKSWYRYRQHPDSCNAQTWRTGRERETRVAFLRWLERYLRARGVTQGTVWDVVQEQLRRFQPSLARRVPEIVRQQTARAQRLTRRLVRQARRTLRAPPVILCYHRVAKLERDPQLLTVTPEHFIEQLAVLRENAAPLGLEALSESARPRRGVVVTFDDGYLDNLEQALPLLREYAIPATIYIATGYVGRGREFWWDDLERLVLGPTRLPQILRLEIANRPREWDLGAETETPDDSWNVFSPSGTRTPRQKLYLDLHSALRPLPETQQQNVLEQLRALTGLSEKPRPLYRCVDRAELQRMAAEPLLTLGAHTITHCDLDYRTRAECAEEIEGSRRQLEETIGREVRHFSYPYGSFNPEVMVACAEGGFRSAAACLDGAVVPGVPAHCLPRFLVHDWDGREFARRLKRFFLN